MNPKHGMQLLLSSDKPKFTVNFEKPLVLDNDRDYAIGLVNLDTVYSFPNIEYDKNNKIGYTINNSNNLYVVGVDTGVYDIDSLNSAIFQKMKEFGHYDSVNNKSYIKFHHNKNTGIVEMSIKNGCIVYFNIDCTFRELLGFESKIYSKALNKSTERVNINSVNTILIHVDVTEKSFVNSTLKPVIHSFSPNVPPGFKIVESPKNIIYVKINQNHISHINVKITDQDGNLLNFRGEKISMRLHIK